jgi:hypothetical protein
MEELPVSKPTEEVVGKSIELIAEGRKITSDATANHTSEPFSEI